MLVTVKICVIHFFLFRLWLTLFLLRRNSFTINLLEFVISSSASAVFLISNDILHVSVVTIDHAVDGFEVRVHCSERSNQKG